MARKLKKPQAIRLVVTSVSEKIRTPDTLVRSQVLYPAELHSHIQNTAIIINLSCNFVKQK